MSLAVDEVRWRHLRTVLGLGALFLLPLAASFWLYYGAGWRPAGTTNHGELIQPPIPLPAVKRASAAERSAAHDVFRRQWTLVYVGNGGCDRDCREALYLMRQTRLALNKDMSRIESVFLVTDGCCDRGFLAREHAGLLVIDTTAADAQAALRPFPTRERAHTLFIVDPLGNLMMRYDARRNPRGLFDDLKKLLQLSHIG